MAETTWTGVEGEYPSNGIDSAPDFEPPYPVGMWRIEIGYNNGYPYHKLLRNVPMNNGAFENSDIERVKVPLSVKTIGAYAFSNTKLRHVRIAADATISSTSVPEGCIVNRYPDDRYEQLYDCDGKAVLDCDGARVYVLKEDMGNG